MRFHEAHRLGEGRYDHQSTPRFRSLATFGVHAGFADDGISVDNERTGTGTAEGLARKAWRLKS